MDRVTMLVPLVCGKRVHAAPLREWLPGSSGRGSGNLCKPLAAALLKGCGGFREGCGRRTKAAHLQNLQAGAAAPILTTRHGKPSAMPLRQQRGLGGFYLLG